MIFVFFSGLRGFVFLWNREFWFCLIKMRVFLWFVFWGISDGGCFFVVSNYEENRVSKRYAASPLYNTPVAKGDALETEKERLTTPSFFSFTSPFETP